MKTRNVVLLGLLGVALFLFVPGVVIVAIVVPKLTASRLQALEIAAIQEIRTIQSAEVQYVSQYGKYAATLTELGPQSAGLISSSLALGEKGGYVFTLAATSTGFAITASPKVYNNNGRRSFYSDETLSIHQSWSQEPANASSPELK